MINSLAIEDESIIDVTVDAIRELNKITETSNTEEVDRIIYWDLLTSFKGKIESRRLIITANDPMLFYMIGLKTSKFILELKTKNPTG